MGIKDQIYNQTEIRIGAGQTMAKRMIVTEENGEGFGKRLARLRKEKGLSQRGLAAEIGITQRMIAYYEKETQYPPSHILHLLSKALSVSADSLLGIDDVRQEPHHDTRLWRRFKLVEQLPPAPRRQLTQIIDAFLDQEKLKKRTLAP